VAPKTESPSLAGLDRNALLSMYRTILLSRKIDDKEIQLKRQNKIYFQINGVGHEAVGAAMGQVFKPGHDWFFFYYRDRAASLALGLTPLEMFLQAAGAADEPQSGARQMPSHFSSSRLHIANTSSPTGTQFLQACGCAEAGLYAAARPDAGIPFASDEVVVVTTGDGTTSEGEFWESLSTASNRKLPVVYVVEDNGYAISVPVEVNTPGGSISKLVASFPDLLIREVDGCDPLATVEAYRAAAAHARARKGPALVHAHVIRPYSHSLSDDEAHYKTKDERDAESRRDPVKTFAETLVREGIVEREVLDAMNAQLDEEVARAADAALAAPRPRPESALEFVYSPTVDPTSARFAGEPRPSGEPTTMVDLLNACLKDEMARDPRIVVFGEDVADASKEASLPHVPGKGGVFKVTHGLQRQFGSTRVFNSPLAEANIVGRAVGMATRGMKPVVEIQFFDYIWPAMMQLRDEMSMLRYRSSNNFSCPMVVRVPIGGYLRGGAPYHSQSGVSIFAHCPGIRIVFPSNAIDAAGLLRTAIRCDDPVMFLEHKHLYRQTYNKGVYPGADYMIPFGKGALRRDGSDVVVLSWGALVQRSILAAQQAEKDGVSVAVFDLRTIVPYDWDGIVEQVRKTNRVVIAHEDQLTCGFGAEIAARISDELFEYLDAPIKRVAAMDCPVAYCPDLEEVILPQSGDVLTAVRELARY
jgi:2-oxoisovalerate dehydrogenase E1 component